MGNRCRADLLPESRQSTSMRRPPSWRQLGVGAVSKPGDLTHGPSGSCGGARGAISLCAWAQRRASEGSSASHARNLTRRTQSESATAVVAGTRARVDAPRPSRESECATSETRKESDRSTKRASKNCRSVGSRRGRECSSCIDEVEWMDKHREQMINPENKHFNSGFNYST